MFLRIIMIGMSFSMLHTEASADKLVYWSHKLQVDKQVYYEESYATIRQQLRERGYKIITTQHSVPGLVFVSDGKGNYQISLNKNCRNRKCDNFLCRTQLVWEGSIDKLPTSEKDEDKHNAYLSSADDSK